MRVAAPSVRGGDSGDVSPVRARAEAVVAATVPFMPDDAEGGAAGQSFAELAGQHRAVGSRDRLAVERDQHRFLRDFPDQFVLVAQNCPPFGLQRFLAEAVPDAELERI